MSTRPTFRSAVAALALAGGLVVGVACGTEAQGVEACRRIEKARCRQAPACGIDLSIPVHSDGKGEDVAACERYYDTACLHGLVSQEDPGNVATEACVDAIGRGDCSVVRAPETATECAFLSKPPPAEDAGDAAAADAGTDGSSS
ncbi:MAG: hypothetical protein U0169_14110 [Polyangiaceae bacterium]